jgi:hypothetical protein
MMHHPHQFCTGVARLVGWRTVRRVLASFLLLVSLSAAGVELNSSSEYQVKAAFLFNFAKYIDWPAEAMGDASQPFNICFVGDKSISQDLQQVVSGKSIANHSIRIIQVHAPGDSHVCHILFVASSSSALEALYIARLGESSVLTVGEKPGFCRRGGIINFWMDADHVRFEISPKAAQRAHLRPSSKLLSLARLVEGPSDSGGSQ